MPLLLNLLGGIAAWFTAKLGTDVVKLLVKLGFFTTMFTLVVYPGIKALMSISSSIRHMIENALSAFASNASNGGCLFALLGIDDFLTSALSVFTGAITVYGTFLGVILTYKFSLKAYNYFFKATV